MLHSTYVQTILINFTVYWKLKNPSSSSENLGTNKTLMKRTLLQKPVTTHHRVFFFFFFTFFYFSVGFILCQKHTILAFDGSFGVLYWLTAQYWKQSSFYTYTLYAVQQCVSQYHFHFTVI